MGAFFWAPRSYRCISVKRSNSTPTEMTHIEIPGRDLAESVESSSDTEQFGGRPSANDGAQIWCKDSHARLDVAQDLQRICIRWQNQTSETVNVTCCLAAVSSSHMSHALRTIFHSLGDSWRPVLVVAVIVTTMIVAEGKIPDRSTFSSSCEDC
jgi:hypothetical protein